MGGPIALDYQGGILDLALEGGKGNVIDGKMVGALRAAIDQYGADPHLKAILIRATGPHFSFGASVEEHRPEQVAGMLSDLHGLLRRIWDLNVPCVGAVRGACLGGGLELVLCCSFLVASPNAKLGNPEIKLGVFAPFASAVLPWRIGFAHAERLLLSGEPVDAPRALAIGLIDEVAEDPEARARTLIAEWLAPKSASSLRFALRAARLTMPRLEETLERLERLYLKELMATRDAREGIAAFLEKRPPAWKDA